MARRAVVGGRGSEPGAAAWYAGGGDGLLEEISEEECLELLAAEQVGRLALSGSPPLIFPVNFVLDGRRIVMRTAVGTKLDAVRADAEVAFEVDRVDSASRTGWSVVVTGHVREEVHLHGETQPRPEPWSAGVRPYWLRLEPITITGRRIRPKPTSDRPESPARVGGAG